MLIFHDLGYQLTIIQFQDLWACFILIKSYDLKLQYGESRGCVFSSPFLIFFESWICFLQSVNPAIYYVVFQHFLPFRGVASCCSYNPAECHSFVHDCTIQSYVYSSVLFLGFCTDVSRFGFSHGQSLVFHAMFRKTLISAADSVCYVLMFQLQRTDGARSTFTYPYAWFSA
jgi:hypothetical protein